jgi:hypothetical protein
MENVPKSERLNDEKVQAASLEQAITATSGEAPEQPKTAREIGRERYEKISAKISGKVSLIRERLGRFAKSAKEFGMETVYATLGADRFAKNALEGTKTAAQGGLEQAKEWANRKTERMGEVANSISEAVARVAEAGRAKTAETITAGAEALGKGYENVVAFGNSAVEAALSRMRAAKAAYEAKRLDVINRRMEALAAEREALSQARERIAANSRLWGDINHKQELGFQVSGI